MKKPEFFVVASDLVTLFNRVGQWGNYEMVLVNNGDVFLRYYSGHRHDGLREPAAYLDRHFVLIFQKAGWFRHHFEYRELVSGTRLDLKTSKKFGAVLLARMQAHQEVV